MRALFQSSRVFWSVALVAAAFVLVGSVELGKYVGAHLLAHGIGDEEPAPSLGLNPPPEVIGGQTHAAVVPGQSAPIWPYARADAVPSPPAPFAGPARLFAPVPGPALAPAAAIEAPTAKPKPVGARTSLPAARPAAPPAASPPPVSAPSSTDRPSSPRPTLAPIAQIAPPHQTLGY